MEKISNYQLCLMGVAIVSVVTLVNTPSQVSYFAQQHSYVPYILAGAVVSLILWIMSKVTARFPNEDILQMIKERLHFIGSPIIILYTIFFLLILGRDLRILSNFVNIYLLQETPLVILSSLFIIPVIFMVRSGIEVIGRLTELFLPIFLIIILLIPILLLKDININYMRPLTEVAWKGIGIGWWYVVSYVGEIILLPFLFSGQTFKFRYGLYGLSIGIGVLVILSVMQLLVLGVHITPRTMFPTYTLIREINITDFLDRFEVLMVGLYFPSTMLKMAYMLFLLCTFINKIQPKANSKLLAAPVGLLAMVFAYWFYEDLIQLVQLNAVWPFFALIFEFLLPVVFFFFLRPKKDKKKEEQPIESNA